MPAIPKVKAQFPDKLAELFRPHPYKVLYGGRDGVKSWSAARALLILGSQKPLRILCARETMDSIRESVHQLLSDQIVLLGLERFYTILQSEIRGQNGTEFVFAGLRKQTVSSIKSYEAIDICWVEEASVVSRRSLTILLPTIRKPNSEIWLTLNPDLETDAVYQDFIVSPPKGAWVCKTSWRDNNWLSDESREKIETLREKDPDAYHHVYEGGTRSTVEGAIYKQEIYQAERDGRIRQVPYDPMQPVDTFWDLGHADKTAIWAAQRTAFEIKMLRYFEDHRQAIDYYLREMQTWGYVFGTAFLPWDGGTRQLGTGRSIEEIMRAKGFKVRVNRQLSVADGINAVRTIFPQLYFDAALCADGLQHLRRYQWGPATALGVPRSQPLHDDASHACLLPGAMVRMADGYKAIEDVRVGDQVWTPCGLSRVLHAGPVKKVNSWIEIKTRTGQILRCTPEHKLFTNRGLVSADALRTSDKILSGEEWNSMLSSWISTVIGSGYRDAITGRIAGVSPGLRTCIGRCGSRLTAPFLRAWTCITRTATHLTIPSPTLSLSSAVSIYAGTLWPYVRLESCFPLANLPIRERLSGMPRQKGSNGIGSTPSRAGFTRSGLRHLAITAGSCLIRLFQTAPSGAPSPVSMKRVTGPKGVPEWVHDLTVENHACYQANGLLVSNSDALRTLAVGIREPERQRVEVEMPVYYGHDGWMM